MEYLICNNVLTENGDFMTALRQGNQLTTTIDILYDNFEPATIDYDNYVKEIWEFQDDDGILYWVQHLKCDDSVWVFSNVKHTENAKMVAYALNNLIDK